MKRGPRKKSPIILPKGRVTHDKIFNSLKKQGLIAKGWKAIKKRLK